MMQRTMVLKKQGYFFTISLQIDGHVNEGKIMHNLKSGELHFIQLTFLERKAGETASHITLRELL